MTLPTSTNSEQVAESLLPSVNLPGDLPPYRTHLLFRILSTTAQKSTRNLRDAVTRVHTNSPTSFSMLFVRIIMPDVESENTSHSSASESKAWALVNLIASLQAFLLSREADISQSDSPHNCPPSRFTVH
ncbi:hypothetical protein NPIL_14341 [Nephila pilipes]|uniref:Uncharacterized protein n=1 Tax=Nephila pilipes TaxID=299642 RepID=A0A8X6UQW5_NEPPI|nr:hypothetical protein NPIL_14341 [Nephila pilipes]